MEAQPAAKPGLVRRIVAYPLTLMVIGTVIVAGVASSTSILFHKLPIPRESPAYALGALFSAVCIVLAYKGFKRWIEREPDGELPLPGAPLELLAGLAFGFALFSTVIAMMAVLGGFEILGMHGFAGFWSVLAMAMMSGLTEEIVFRGLFLRLLEKLVGTWIALFLTSAFFGAAHLGNSNATWFAAFAIALEAGVMLGAAYLVTRRLWLAVGIHAAWNFTQGWVFSVPVSGGRAPVGLFASRRVGPDWLTGGDFGAEASVIALVLATVAGVVLLAVAVKQGRIVPPAWARRRVQT